MSAVSLPSGRPAAGPPDTDLLLEERQYSRARRAGWQRLDEPRLVALTLVAFWLYVIASRLVVRAVWLTEIRAPQMAPLDVYAAQHLLLVPVLAVAYALAYRVGWPRGKLAPALLAHGALAIVVALCARLALFVALGAVGEGRAPDAPGALSVFVSEFRFEDPFWLVTFTEFTLQYLCGLGLAAAIVSWRRYEAQSAARQRQESELVQARLSALRRQLDPHFLFNTLNGIAATVDEDPRRGNEMLMRLAALLRATIADDRESIPLREELETARRYLELHAMRFPERLSLVIEGDPAASEYEVPPLLLQPLVENAALHGLAASEAAVRIEVRSHVEADGSVRIEILNCAQADAAHAPPLPHPRHSPGIGLRNTWERLEGYYGSRFSFELERLDARRVRARLTLPAP